MIYALICFCYRFYSTNGFVQSIDTKLSHPDIKIDESISSGYICKNYAYEGSKIPFIGTGISFIIVILNYILRLIIIYIVKIIGLHTETNQTKIIMTWIFIVQFFNTAIFNLLTYANLKESLGISIFKGSYPDFTFGWYLDVGVPLVTAMIINAVFPLIEFAMWYGLRILLIFYDKSFSCKKYQTRMISIQQYINLYSGPEYLIHYKYSSILNIVFVTFMYGLALPLLFPIALVSLIILYIVEKLCIVYYYKEPPSYDEKLNVIAVKILFWAPLLMYSVGYWMISNKQMFENEAPLNEQANPIVEKTDHVAFKSLSTGPELNFLILTCLLPLCFIIWKVVMLLISKYGPRNSFQSASDENLPNYFDALGGPTLGKLIKEEIDIRRDYGFRTIMDSTLMGILNAHPACRVIQGVGFYDMLYNDKYKEKFQYFHYVGETKQSLMELDCTKVKLTLSIAFEKERSESVSNFVSNCNADKQLLGRIENSNGIDSNTEDKLLHKVGKLESLLAKIDNTLKEKDSKRYREDEEESKKLML